MKKFQFDENDKFRMRVKMTKYSGKAMSIFRYAILIGISYIILSPLISILSKSFFSDSDVYNAMVYLIPEETTIRNYLLAMERSPIKSVEIKELLRQALTFEINNRTVYMKGIDASYSYEGYFIFKTEDMA